MNEVKDKKNLCIHHFGAFKVSVPVYLQRNACISDGVATDTKGNVHRGTFSSTRLISGEITEIIASEPFKCIKKKGTWTPKFTGVLTNTKGEKTYFHNGKRDTYTEKKRLRRIREGKVRLIQRCYRKWVSRRKIRLKGFCQWFDQRNEFHNIEMTCARGTIIAFLQTHRRHKTPESPTSIQAIDRPFSFTPFPYSGIVRKRVIQGIGAINRERMAQGKKMIRSREYLMNEWWYTHALALHRKQCCGER